MSIFGAKPKADEVLTSVSGEDIAQLLHTEGYGPELDTEPGGDPKVRFKVEGITCLVLFYGVKNGCAGSIQFRAAFRDKVPLQKINEWNRTKRRPKAYLDADGELSLDQEVELYGGVTRQNLVEHFGIWRAGLGPCLRFLAD